MFTIRIKKNGTVREYMLKCLAKGEAECKKKKIGQRWQGWL